MSGPYYFGCLGRVGHFLYASSGRTVGADEAGLPWKNLDGPLCPGPRERCHVPTEEQVQGHAAIHHLDGWTALAFWDRSVDPRGNSNSVFLVRGLVDADQVLSLARQHFPGVMSRLMFPIVVVSRPTDLQNGRATCSGCGREGVTAVLPGGWSADPPGWMRRGDALACSPGCAREEAA